MKRISFLFLIMLFLCILSISHAEEAQNITDEFNITSMSKRDTSRVTDGKINTSLKTKAYSQLCFEVEAKEDAKCYGMYIQFNETPESWHVERQDGFKWEIIFTSTGNMKHVYVPLDGIGHFRVIKNSTTQHLVSEITLFSEGEVPSWVQRWNYTPDEVRPEKADIMILVGHPDDEWLFMGGTIPHYIIGQDKNVVVVYATCQNRTRGSELLNGLWQAGMRNYPVIGDFHDGFSSNVKDGYRKWNNSQFNHFVAEQIRKYRPDVLITHDVNGEYGHGGHMVCAASAQKVVPNTALDSYDPESFEKWGAWQVQKLYLHLYKENPIHMDWRVPLKEASGKTALDIAIDGYACHESQHTAGSSVLDGEKFSVKDTGEFSCSEFGLAYSTVGLDVKKNDFLENVAPQPLESKTTSETPTSTNSLNIPATDENGYLLEGTFDYANTEEGRWIHLSPTLQIRIQRYCDIIANTTWYEANIICDIDKGVNVTTFPSVVGQRGKHHVPPVDIVTANQLIFACSTDYYTYRTSGVNEDGIVIRDSEILSDETYESGTKKFPPLDTGALFPDGRFQVYQSFDHTAEEYLAMGATDVFSFGPYLVKNNEINPLLKDWGLGQTPQPRMAIGMVKPGHYVLILEEGRIKNEAIGTSLYVLAQKMQLAGCTEALNLDGGQTSALYFMGEQLNRIAVYKNTTLPRQTTEVLGVGHYTVSD